MGAESYCFEAEGRSPKEVYDALVHDAREKYGYDPYSGTIATTDGYKLVGMENNRPYTKTALKKAHDRMNKDGGGMKWTASIIDCGVTKYLLREVSRKATHKEPPKYETAFECLNFGEHGEEVVGSFKKKEDADDFMKKYLFDHPAGFPRVRKTRKLISGTDTVTDFSITDKIYKSRPHPKSMKGKRIIEIHKYVVYGYAVC